MPETLDAIANALKMARQNKGLTQRDLSARSGLPQSHISKIENGAVDLQTSNLLELARALDLELTLVPRTLLPAVQALQRGGERTGDIARGTARRLKRLLNKARLLQVENPQVHALQRLVTTIADLVTLRPDVDAAQEIFDLTGALEKALHDFSDHRQNAAGKILRQEAHDALADLGQGLRMLRNRLSHRATETWSERRPAYSLGNGDGDG